MGNWVVVVDDEALSLTSAKTLLGSEDMKISCLRSGRDLLKFMDKNEPDLILLDVMMPEMDGFETLEILRKREKEEGKLETPVIFLTGDMDESTEQRGLKLGASDYIHKPFNKDILIRRINNTIQNSRKIESLTEDATVDKLTGFLNKTSGIEHICDLILRESGTFMILDLDSFKLVNDLYGHDNGDRVLEAFSYVVRNNTRSDDIVCRIGGDEFLAFFCDMSNDTAIRALADRLNEQFTSEVTSILGNDHGIPVGISIGAVNVPLYGRNYETLFKMADEELYKAKQNGKHCCSIYSDSSDAAPEANSPEDELERISRIIEERNEGREALVLGTESFTAVYHFVSRYNSRYGGRALKLLLVVSIEDETEQLAEKTMTELGNVLKTGIRKSDIIMKNKTNQFFVLFPVMNVSAYEKVIERIIEEWKRVPGFDRCKVSYAVEVC